MKKPIKLFLIIWLILFALFNVIVFITEFNIGNFDVGFWLGYIFISIEFLALLFCELYVFNSDSLTKLFYNLSMIKLAYISVIVSVVVGTCCMTIPLIPSWIGVIICTCILAFSIISILKSTITIETVTQIDDKIKNSTSFIKCLSDEAETLILSAQSNEMREECTKIYEIIRYSDPISNSKTFELEEEISQIFESFKESVVKNSFESAKQQSNELIHLVYKRNGLCKRSKV